MDNIPTLRYDTLELCQLALELPSERMGSDHNIGEAIRQRNAVAEAVYNIHIEVSSVGCSFSNELA